MPYSNQSEVETWGQLATGDLGSHGYNYDNTIQALIKWADHAIDDYCSVPRGFFEAGGIAINNEYLNGTDVAYIGGVTRFFNWYFGGASHLKFKYKPVLTVEKLEEETSAGTWTTRTEGRGNDFIVVDDGVRFIRNTPSWSYKNVRATYKVGYTQTPGRVNECSARLAASYGHRIHDAKSRSTVQAGGLSVTQLPTPNLTSSVFTKDLKKLVRNYKCAVYAFV